MTSSEFKALTALQKIQALTGIMKLTGDHEQDVSILTTRCVVINLICRVEAGEASADFLDSTIDKIFPKE